MILSIIENLERILSEAVDVKEHLRQICETSCNLLSPPGSHINGFRIVKTTPKENIVNSESGNEVSPIELAIENITDLIAYGKVLRSTSLRENKEALRTGRNDLRGLPQRNDNNKCNVKPRNIKCPIEAETVAVKSENCIRSKRSVQTKPVTKSIPSQTNKTTNAASVVEINSKVNTSKTRSRHTSSDDNQSLSTNMVSSDSEVGSISSPVLYFHTCSPKLTDTISSLKLPEALKNLLKQHYYYEHKKVKPKVKEDTHRFKERFEKLIKSKLQNHLKTNIAQEDRYMKYLDIADTDCKKHKNTGKPCTMVHYRSEVQLCSLEGRYHRLMELHLQRRLINSVSSLVN